MQINAFSQSQQQYFILIYLRVWDLSLKISFLVQQCWSEHLSSPPPPSVCLIGHEMLDFKPVTSQSCILLMLLLIFLYLKLCRFNLGEKKMEFPNWGKERNISLVGWIRKQWLLFEVRCWWGCPVNGTFGCLAGSLFTDPSTYLDQEY